MISQLTTERVIEIPIKEGSLGGVLHHVPDTKGMIIFAPGGGSGHVHSRNHMIAESLNYEGYSTLQIDLLTVREVAIDPSRANPRVDTELLASRLIIVTDWVRDHLQIFDMPFGYFAAGTGTAAALAAATKRPHTIKAIVSRGGRPDLAGPALHFVFAPTLLIVGEYDLQVTELNRQALKKMPVVSKSLEIIPEATHLFDEAGAMGKVADLTSDWFRDYLVIDRKNKKEDLSRFNRRY